MLWGWKPKVGFAGVWTRFGHGSLMVRAGFAHGSDGFRNPHLSIVFYYMMALGRLFSRLGGRQVRAGRLGIAVRGSSCFYYAWAGLGWRVMLLILLGEIGSTGFWPQMDTDGRG